jgi:NADPH:quinone reductase-like Zn-dependent oxidoreductase
MRALVATGYGPVEDLRLADVPAPVPGPGQVLLRVQAAAVNPFDIRLVTGELRHVFPVEHPLVLGMEAAGVVDEVGEGVTDLAPGDEVVAFTFGASGSIAERTLAAVGPNVARRPAGLDPARAASIPVAGMTAAGLVEVSQLSADRSVLVIGATGGVGLFLVQMAARQGARVLATAGPADAELVRALGAHATVDHTRGDGAADVVADALTLCPDGVDVVVELVHGGPDLAITAAAARPGGRLVSPHHGGPEGFDRDVSATYIHVDPVDGLLQSLVDQVAAGQLTATVDSTYPFTDAAAAAADFTTRHTCGKVVITF